MTTTTNPVALVVDDRYIEEPISSLQRRSLFLAACVDTVTTVAMYISKQRVSLQEYTATLYEHFDLFFNGKLNCKYIL